MFHVCTVLSFIIGAYYFATYGPTNEAFLVWIVTILLGIFVGMIAEEV